MLGQARHPLVKALKKVIYCEEQIKLMNQALCATEGIVFQNQPKTISDYKNLCLTNYGSRLQLLCNTFSDDGSLNQLARCIATTTWLSTLYNDIEKNHIKLPSDIFFSSSLNLKKLNKENEIKNFNLLVLSFLEELHLINYADLKIIARNKSLDPAVKHAAQSLVLLKKLKNSKFNPFQVYQLLPIKLLWSAWRI